MAKTSTTAKPARAKKAAKAKPKKAAPPRKEKRKTKGAWSLADVPFEVPDSSTWRKGWKEPAYALLRAYNHGLLEDPRRKDKAKRGIVTTKGVSEANLQCFYAVHVWATAHRMPSLLWVTWVVRRAMIAGAAGVSLKHLFAEGSVDAFREDDAVSADMQALADERLTRSMQPVDATRPRHDDLYWGAELLKWNHRCAGHEILCIEDTELHGGFKAASTSCASCPLAERCKDVTRDYFRRTRERKP